MLTTGCQDQSSGAIENPRPLGDAAREVEIARVTLKSIDRSITVMGSFDALERAVISSKVSGRLLSIPVDLGSSVKRGDLLAQIDPRDYELKLRQSEAALAQARAHLGLELTGADDRVDPTLTSFVQESTAVLVEAQANRDRVLELSQQGIVPQSQLETAIATFGVASNRYSIALEDAKQRQAMVLQRRAEWEIARQELQDASIEAPFEGVIQSRQANAGEYLNVGAPAVTLVRIHPLRLRLEVPERASAQIKLGQIVRATVTADERIHEGTLTRISPALNDQNRVLVVEADVPNRDGSIHPGAFARAQILTRPASDALVVPAAAIRTFAGIQKVFVVDGNTAVEKEVTLGSKADQWVEVLTGIEEGDTVVVSPGNLRGGDRVAVTQ